MNTNDLAFLRQPIFETIAIAAGAFFIAMVLGAPAGLLIARGRTAGRLVRTLATLVRAVPDLVLAIIFVVAIGLGPAPGTLALGLSAAASYAKISAELLQSVSRAPFEALRATGATASASFLVGVLPAAWTGLVGFALYIFESIMRASVIVGVVGAGGLGAAIVTSINLANYYQLSAYIAALVALVALVDLASEHLRTRAPLWLTLGVFSVAGALGIAAFSSIEGAPWRAFASAGSRVVTYLVRAFPPDLSERVLRTALSGIGETLAVAVAGTVIGALLAVPLGLLAARPIARGWMRGTGYRPWSIAPEFATRGGLTVGRAFPPIALALLGLSIVGLGPKAGAFALAIHTAGVLGKLYAESLELADSAPAEALVAGGSTAVVGVLVGLVPGSVGALAAHLLYRWEWNIRASTVLGIVGAGGLGQAIYNAQQLLFDHQLLTYVSVAIILVLASDAIASRVRASLRLATLER